MNFENPAVVPIEKKSGRLGKFAKGILVGAAISLGSYGAASEAQAGEGVKIEKKDQEKRKVFSGSVDDPRYGKVIIEISQSGLHAQDPDKKDVEILVNGKLRELIATDRLRDGGTLILTIQGETTGSYEVIIFPAPQKNKPPVYSFSDKKTNEEVRLNITIHDGK